MIVRTGSKIARASTGTPAGHASAHVGTNRDRDHAGHMGTNRDHDHSGIPNDHAGASRDHEHDGTPGRHASAHVSTNRDHDHAGHASAHAGTSRDHEHDGTRSAHVGTSPDRDHRGTRDAHAGTSPDHEHDGTRSAHVGTRPTIRGAVLAALAGTIAACGGGNTDSTPSAPPLGKLIAALLGAADQASAPWRCAAIDAPAFGAEEIKTGDRAWRLASQTLERVAPDNESVIGVVADAAGAAPRTIAALGRIRAALEAAKVDIVLTLGGMGTTAEEIEATLGTLADHASWPVIALPGDLEPMTAHIHAIATLRARGDAVLDGRSLRWIDLGAATIGTLPGGGAIERLAAGADGCAWQPADIIKVTTELTAKRGIRIVASTEAPRQPIDGEAGGELALIPSKALPTDIALHGPLTPVPSPARTGTRDGAGIGLSPGTVDATPRLPAPHRPAAGVLVVRGASWTWRPVVDAAAAK
jgi:hypothetical protein